MRILIADDHGMMREGLKFLIKKKPIWKWSARPKTA